MHPGNILVRVVQPKNSNNTLIKSRPHVVFLDVGMTAELSSNDRVNLLEFFKAVARRDGRTAAESTLKLSRKQNCPNPKAFIEVICHYLASLFNDDQSLDFSVVYYLSPFP
jgi:aarF domain-containing kinase